VLQKTSLRNKYDISRVPKQELHAYGGPEIFLLTASSWIGWFGMRFDPRAMWFLPSYRPAVFLHTTAVCPSAFLLISLSSVQLEPRSNLYSSGGGNWRLHGKAVQSCTFIWSLCAYNTVTMHNTLKITAKLYYLQTTYGPAGCIKYNIYIYIYT
jgi:hypothetical protein